jgi:hypothetical protein
MMLTVQQLVENARARHPAFTKLAWPDGALLLFLNTYQRTKLLELADSIEPLVGQAKQIASVIAGALVGSDAGVPYYITTSGDGWPVQNSGGVPYVDFTQPPIALDPFGATGGTPGFPLPTEFIRLINITAASNYDAQMQVEDDAGVEASSCSAAGARGVHQREPNRADQIGRSSLQRSLDRRHERDDQLYRHADAGRT